MTIKDFLNSNPPELAEVMAASVSIWSNDACRGYCIDAMQRAGMERKQISRVLAALQLSFDEMTADEAERVYRQF